MSYLMVDRATPPTDGELSMLRDAAVWSVGGYVGGVNNGGRAWKPTDVVRVRAAGFRFLPIYVGENDCDGCKKPVALTSHQGITDGLDAVSSADRFGCVSGPLCLDVEYSTYMGNVAGALAYQAAWAGVVDQAGFLPVQYSAWRTPQDYVPTVPTGMWVANWDGVGDLAKIPNGSRFTGVGWQYADNWRGFDVSHVDGVWWAPVLAPLGSSAARWFTETGHTIAYGFRAYWESHADAMQLFGFPLSEEFKDAEGVTVQWFERARFEWRPGRHLPFDVQLGRVGAEAMDADQAANPVAFERVPQP
ncbi:MAG: glycoside hydrolase domain-containing protein [Nitrolancea sp.]